VIKTLLVDANNLLKIGFHGVKDFFHEGKHVGGIWHFLNTLRRFIEEENFDKVVVMWDGEDNSNSRKSIYPQYKENRKTALQDFKEESFSEQKRRVKQYLEEMFVRQVDIGGNEADDLIAYYCQLAKDEVITIFSADRDLTQLISNNVSVYSPNTKLTYKKGDYIRLYEAEIPHYNVTTYKIISGDKSDNIDGIYFLGEKTLIKLFPEILEKPTSVSDILIRAETLHSEDKENKVLQNLLTGKTKSGIYGNEFFEINTKIVDLSNPLITEEGKQIVELYYSETLDPEGRGHRNLIRMMMEDGFFKFLPKHDEAWVNFVRPFMKLTRKEKKQFKTKK
jgi:5'-3' exonuclease